MCGLLERRILKVMRMIYKFNFGELCSAVLLPGCYPRPQAGGDLFATPRIQADSSIRRALARLSSVIVIPASMRATSSIRSF